MKWILLQVLGKVSDKGYLEPFVNRIMLSSFCFVSEFFLVRLRSQMLDNWSCTQGWETGERKMLTRKIFLVSA